MTSHLHFAKSSKGLIDRILIPKYYDPDLAEGVRVASEMFELPVLGSLLLPGKAGSQLGVWLPRENYGTGTVPFVRTSDLYHWRIRPDFKKGVSEEVYEQYANRADVRPGDMLMVAHGSYLIGDVALVMESDKRVLLSDHVFRLRTDPYSGIEHLLLLAALSTRFVKRQVRARQFSAEILDKIGERHLGIRVPIPKDRSTRARVGQIVQEVMTLHSSVRARIAETANTQRAPGPRATSHYGFSKTYRSLKNSILIPRYYDPDLEIEIEQTERDTGRWITIGALARDGALQVAAGVEVGKMAYGTGSIPFVRTSDLVDWELFRDPTQGVSQEIFDAYQQKASLRANDVLVVRDGTYLVGSSALVVNEDLPALLCGGILRLRTASDGPLTPHALLGLLNLPAVRRQMRCKQFTRDVIDTLGPRLMEVKIPPPESELAKEMETSVREVMQMKSEIKRLMDEAISLLEPSVPLSARGRPGWSMR
jgi:hypothetical protein